MTDRVKELAMIAMDYAAEQYGPQRAGEKVWDPLTYDRKFAELVATDIIALIRLHMPRNGVNSPENTMSKQHIDNIARVYGVVLPVSNVVYDRVMAEGSETLMEKAVRLRELTNYPIMECKRALIRCDGDFEKAAKDVRDWPWLGNKR